MAITLSILDEFASLSLLQSFCTDPDYLALFAGGMLLV